MEESTTEYQSTQETSSSFEDLYRYFLFLLSLYVVGDLVCQRLLRIVPSLVGQIAVGILWGPFVLQDSWFQVPSPTSWTTFGDLGLVLFICQAGLEMDLPTLEAIGLRGTLMAIVGSIVPISLGTLIAFLLLGLPWKEAIATGCSFGPTSAGIAMNVLQQCGILQSSVGQLVVAIAIVDDLLALVILSQLRALTGEELQLSTLLLPIVSAVVWLIVGGAVAIYGMPILLDQVRLTVDRLMVVQSSKYYYNYCSTCSNNKNKEANEESGEQQEEGSDETANEEEQRQRPASSYNHNWHTLLLLVALLPATYYSQASYLLGAFLAGLAVCRHDKAAEDYNQQLGTIIPWLMRIFFGASIAFQIPVTLLNSPSVIGNGVLLSMALLGKIAVGPLMTPVLSPSRGAAYWDRQYWRDCCIVGFSMAGEAEFAFLVARFGFEKGLLQDETYASVNFAILLSTVTSPVLLRVALAAFETNDSSSANSQDDPNEEEEKEGHL
jgi:Kef-type K+ transport system membrane component KefB